MQQQQQYQQREGSTDSFEGHNAVGIGVPLPRPKSLDGVPGERIMRLESIMRGTSKNTSTEEPLDQNQPRNSTSSNSSSQSTEGSVSFGTPKKRKKNSAKSSSARKSKDHSSSSANKSKFISTNLNSAFDSSELDTIPETGSQMHPLADELSSNKTITDFFDKANNKPLSDMDIQRVRNDLEARELLVRQREAKTMKKEAELLGRMEEMEAQLSLQRQESERYISASQSELENCQSELEAFKENSSSALISLLRNIAEKEKMQRYEELMKNNVRIGYLSTRRQGLSYQPVEVWEDGEAFIQLKERIAELKEEKEEIDGAKKLLMRKRNLITNSLDEPSRNMLKIEILELEEIVKLRSTLWKTESAKASIQESNLIAERISHKTMSRILYDEKSSRYNHHPVLNSRYLLYFLIGKGGFSEVYKGYDILEHRFVAVKLHEINSRWTNERKENFVRHAHRETKILQSLDHPRVVSCFDIFLIDNNTLATVLEFCEGEDLDAFLKREGTLCERSARCIMIQIFRGLKYLSSQENKIIHYDLKPSNILFHKGEVKIADFGLSKLVEDQTADRIENTSPGYGSYWYLPPECFAPQEGQAAPMISSKVDIWSAGIIFYQLLYGKRPVGHDMAPSKELIDSILKSRNGFQFPAKPIVSESVKQFILQCVAFNPNERPDIDSIFEHSYFLSQKSLKRKSS